MAMGTQCGSGARDCSLLQLVTVIALLYPVIGQGQDLEFARLTHEYRYTIGAWSECQASCGSNATQTREVNCLRMQTLLRPDGSKVPHLQVTVKLGQCLWRLPMLPPLMKRRCGEAECPQAAWEASDEWTECRPSCGAGERTRQVTCMAPTGDGNASEPVADSHCSAAGTKPKAVLPCSGIPCTPVWAQMPYTKCDPLSWPSTRQRDVLCLRRTSLTMYERLADEECAIVKPKPRTSRGCPRPRTSGK